MGSLENRIERLEQLVGIDDGNGPAQAEYCSWTPGEPLPDVPPGTVLTVATERLREQLMLMDDSVPRCPDEPAR